MPLFIILLGQIACVDYGLHHKGTPNGGGTDPFPDRGDSGEVFDTGDGEEFIDTGEAEELLEPAIRVSPAFLPFGLVETEKTLSFKVFSEGSTPLTVDELRFDTLPAPFEVTVLENLPIDLEPGESFEVLISYSATDGAWSGEIDVFSNDPVRKSEVELSAVTEMCDPVPMGDFFVTPGLVGGRLQLVESNDDGTFGLPRSFGRDVDETITDPLIADFTGDGALDVIARGDGTSLLYLHTYDLCTGKWITTRLEGPRTFRPLTVGDFDGDGNMDVAGWNAYRIGLTGMGNGDGTFTWIPGSFSTVGAWTGYVMLASQHALDLTGDEHPDLLIVEYRGVRSTETGVFVAPGNGDGTFGALEYVRDLDEASNGVDVGDIDGDGWNDIVAGLDDDGDAGVLFVMHGNASGFGAPVTLLDLEPTMESGYNHAGQGSVYMTDWDVDGDLDLLIGHRPNSGDFSTVEVGLFKNDGTGSFDIETPVLTPSQMPSGPYMAVPVRL